MYASFSHTKEKSWNIFLERDLVHIRTHDETAVHVSLSTYGPKG